MKNRLILIFSCNAIIIKLKNGKCFVNLKLIANLRSKTLNPKLHLKKYFKYVAIAVVLILSSVLLRSITSKDEEGAAVEKTAIKVDPPILIERYSDSETKKVSHKLDSLLKSINKRHVFHASRIGYY